MTNNYEEYDDDLIDTVQAAFILGLNPQSLYRWRQKNIKLDYIKTNTRILYRKSDVLKLRDKRQQDNNNFIEVTK